MKITMVNSGLRGSAGQRIAESSLQTRNDAHKCIVYVFIENPSSRLVETVRLLSIIRKIISSPRCQARYTGIPKIYLYSRSTKVCLPVGFTDQFLSNLLLNLNQQTLYHSMVESLRISSAYIVGLYWRLK